MINDTKIMADIAKRDGLDIIAQELQGAGFSPVIENTGGFTLWVAVYGSAGYIVANNEAVFVFTLDENDEGEDLKYRDGDKEFGEHLPAEIWARQVAETFTNYAYRVGSLVEMA